MSTQLLTTSSLFMVHEGSRSLKEAASVKSEWQSLSGKICPSCWKTEKVQNLLALSSFFWDNVQFQTHLQQWLSEVLESACLRVEQVTHGALPCSSNRMFIYCIEQCQFLKCTGPVGARAFSGTVQVPAVPSTQHEKTLGFLHLYFKLKILLSTAEL